MKKLRVLVGNEPRSYREVLSCCLQHLRPNVEVLLTEPEHLDREVMRGLPGPLVFCSRVTPVVERKALAWVELYPEGEPLIAIKIDGLRLRGFDELGLSNILWIVDRAGLLSQGSAQAGRIGGSTITGERSDKDEPQGQQGVGVEEEMSGRAGYSGERT